MNLKSEAVRLIEPGTYLIDHGPVTMVVKAFLPSGPLMDAETLLFNFIEEQLAELSSFLPLLRSRACHEAPLEKTLAMLPEGCLAADMVKAVYESGDPLLTPMAAVAGAMADRLADRLEELGAEKVVANNGGDIAIRLKAGQQLILGIKRALNAAAIQDVITITAEDGIGGVATSGLGGRSLTMGIASGLTAFGKRCAMADALATSLANASFVDVPQVKRCLAAELDPMSDIADLLVVSELDELPADVQKQALEQVLAAAQMQLSAGHLKGLVATVGEMTVIGPEAFACRVRSQN